MGRTVPGDNKVETRQTGTDPVDGEFKGAQIRLGGDCVEMKAAKEGRLKTLGIKWSRLVDERGRTCKRCGATEKQVNMAVRGLKAALARFGVKVTLEKKRLSRKAFLKDTLKSNRVEINGRPLEKWINARTGRTYCCDACGGAECRTVRVGRKVYETVPAALIIRAAIAAAAAMLKGAGAGACCGSGKSGKRKACGCGCGG